MDEQELLAFLETHQIPYQRFEHPPVFTVEQAQFHLQDAPGAGTKNLLLMDKRHRRAIFVMVSEEKRVDLKALGAQIGTNGLHFASGELLWNYLKVEPGAVTSLALINDADCRVELYIDGELWQKDAIQCHPLVNTATLVIRRDDLARFFDLTHHPYQLIEI